MFKPLTLVLLAFLALSAEEAPKKPSLAEEAFNKAIEANTKECDKAYMAYQKALEEANKRIIKSLEGVKADLNDTKKYGKLSITDRAKALEEVEGKIAEVKKGALGSVVVERNEKEGDLLGDAGVDLAKAIVGTWEVFANGVTINMTIDDKQNYITSSGFSGLVQLNANGTFDVTFPIGVKHIEIKVGNNIMIGKSILPSGVIGVVKYTKKK